MGIPANIQMVRDAVRQAAARSNRDPGDITLVAVSKTAGLEEIREAYDLGLRHFGENRLQEAMDKIPRCPPDITWHFIGHLQTNKAKGVLEGFSLIHSLDRYRLAKRLSSLAAAAERTVRVLVQINIAGEAAKFGLPPGETEGFIRDIGALPGLEVVGLMAMAPFAPDPEESRPYFRDMKAIFDSLQQVPGVNLEILSMGMSGDFTVAVEEGATMLRIGSLIFGSQSND